MDFKSIFNKIGNFENKSDSKIVYIDLEKLEDDYEAYDIDTLLKVEKKTHNPIVQFSIALQIADKNDEEDDVKSEKNMETVYEWLFKAAEQNHAESMECVIDFYEERGELKKVKEWETRLNKVREKEYLDLINNIKKGIDDSIKAIPAGFEEDPELLMLKDYREFMENHPESIWL